MSEVMGLPPCVLCWYQRVCMYPLAAVATVGLLTRDRGVARYAGPLALVGLAVAIYHNLLYYHVIPESITPCATGVSCTERQIEWFGYVTIPLLSLSAFLIIAACLVWFRARLKETALEINKLLLGGIAAGLVVLFVVGANWYRGQEATTANDAAEAGGALLVRPHSPTRARDGGGDAGRILRP